MRTTKEQRSAAEALAQAAPGLRVTVDAEGWPLILGKVGRLEREHVLTVYTDRPRLHAKLLAIPGVERWQRGDVELRARVEPSAVQAVAKAIGARRRRLADAGAAERLRALHAARRACSQAPETAPGEAQTVAVGSE